MNCERVMDMRIKKVINNNILCVIDKKGNEKIVCGRGIGFQRKIGELVSMEKIEKVYHMEGKEEQQKLRELVEQIPLEHIKLTQELIDYIKTQITQELNETLLITLSDHISFAIKRIEQGIVFENPLKNEIMCYYPLEYRLGKYCLKIIEKTFHVCLNADESAFIALHIVNAELNTNMNQVYDITKLLEGCVRVTEFYFHKKLNRDSLDFSRFIVHLRYLMQRLFQNNLLPDSPETKDVSFRQLIQENCQNQYECAKRIAIYIEANCDKTLSEEELVYLAIHLKRFSTTQE